MPFESDKQRKFLYSEKPEVAKKFAKHKGSKKPKRNRAIESLKKHKP